MYSDPTLITKRSNGFQKFKIMVISNIWTSGREDPSPRMEKIIHGGVHQ
jgi:hypothetical protein